MGMAEYSEKDFGEITPLPSDKEKQLFEKANELAKKLHFGDMDELARFRDLRESQARCEEKLDMIIKHFNIVRIIG